ncbi:hypothetical protein DH2020_013690 [Rehmannia glutinosa]|uniref:Pre-mRNA-splicing factor SLU7 n=1 Tax=Rehmannia glutinosa TaxID=99300 RepID=A0ABR0X5I8_REHGL
MEGKMEKLKSLKHQRKWKSDPDFTKSWYDRGAKTFQANKYKEGACENCGAMTHDKKLCVKRPRKLSAKWTGKNIAADEKIGTIELDYDGKRDRWNGYDAASYEQVIQMYEARDEARNKHLKEQQLKKLEEKNVNQNNEDGINDDEDNDDSLGVDEAKADESKQMHFAKVEKRMRELLLGQSEREVEYDRAGRILKGQETTSIPKTKYEEDVHISNHKSVWGSWWKDHQWGYKCFQQTLRNSYCIGAAGIDY